MPTQEMITRKDWKEFREIDRLYKMAAYIVIAIPALGFSFIGATILMFRG